MPAALRLRPTACTAASVPIALRAGRWGLVLSAPRSLLGCWLGFANGTLATEEDAEEELVFAIGRSLCSLFAARSMTCRSRIDWWKARQAW
eukprot:6478222-Amphidinium_carterae.1